MSLYSEHDSLAIKYNIFLQSGNPLPSESAVTQRCMAKRPLVPLRDLWSSLARSSSAPLSRSWWGPRERPGTGSGHCMSSLDTRSRQKSVSDEGLVGNREVESRAGYTWGFSYIGESACNIPASPPPQSQSPQSDALPVSYGVWQWITWTNGKLSLLWGIVFCAPQGFSCRVCFYQWTVGIAGGPRRLF